MRTLMATMTLLPLLLACAADTVGTGAAPGADCGQLGSAAASECAAGGDAEAIGAAYCASKGDLIFKDVGEGCWFSWQCKQDEVATTVFGESVCKPGYGSDGSIAWVCAARGAHCTTDDHCPAGYYCGEPISISDGWNWCRRL